MSSEWGKLIGVRPIKLVHYLKKDHPVEEIKKILSTKYLIQEQVIELMINIANTENKVMSEVLDNKDNVALYVNIPFCPSRCTYCSFISIDNSKFPDLKSQYVDALVVEINSTIEYLIKANKNIKIIYIGGGTPSVLDDRELAKLLSAISKHSLQNIIEYTVEAGRADTITKSKLQILIKHGVNRISINPQSMKQQTLDYINRKHSINEIIMAFKLAKNLGFIVNMDLILGLPNEDINDVISSIESVIKINPENITIHNLAKKRTSYMNQQNEFYAINEEVTQEMNNTSKLMLTQAMYKPYYLYRQKNTSGGQPNIGYSKEGFECLYNIAMISEMCSVYGCGAGSITKVLDDDGKFSRLSTAKDARIYIKKINEIIDKKIRWFKNENSR